MAGATTITMEVVGDDVIITTMDIIITDAGMATDLIAAATGAVITTTVDGSTRRDARLRPAASRPGEDVAVTRAFPGKFHERSGKTGQAKVVIDMPGKGYAGQGSPGAFQAQCRCRGDRPDA